MRPEPARDVAASMPSARVTTAHPIPNWSGPPHLRRAKLAAVRQWLDALPTGTRVLDAGCGEGILVEDYRDRLAIEGVDANYESDRIRTGSLTALPYDAASSIGSSASTSSNI